MKTFMRSASGVAAVCSRTKYTVSRMLLLLVFVLISSTSFAQTAVEQHGQLRVEGTKIVDKDGNPVQLRGMSFFWSQWIGKYYNKETVQWLRDDWKCNIVRAAMAVDQGGYATNPQLEMDKVTAVVDAAIELGIYVIIDFHVHDAEKYQAEATVFFSEMAKRYGNTPNVIYEPWNEPVHQSWLEVIKPYHETVIAAIREHDPDNIIVLGTRTWSQRVDEAALNPVNQSNIAYTLHYYAATHKQELRNKATAALNQGVALFVTEYGTSPASGDGEIDVASALAWWAFLDEHKISHLNWSVADKRESSAALQPGASAQGGWPLSQLTASGQLVRNEIRSKNEAPLSASPANPANELEIIYANPSVDSFNLHIKGSFTYHIYDQYGKMVESGRGRDNAVIGSRLKAGIYFAKIQHKRKEKIIKLIKQ